MKLFSCLQEIMAFAMMTVFVIASQAEASNVTLRKYNEALQLFAGDHGLRHDDGVCHCGAGRNLENTYRVT